MTRYRLRQLEIEGFRGINNEGNPLVLKFDTESVNSLFAQNGAGKSSIFEALEYAITGGISKLDEMHQDEQPVLYYVNRFHSQKRATIKLKFAPTDGTPDVDITVECTSNGLRSVSSANHPDPKGLLASLDQELVLLDYRTFQDFIDDSPLERGRSFAGLLGLSRVAETRRVLEVLSNMTTLERDLGITALSTATNTAQLRGGSAKARVVNEYVSIFAKEPEKPVKITAVEDAVLGHLKTTAIVGERISATKLSDVDFQDLRDAISRAEGGNDQKRLTDLKTEVATLTSLGPAEGIDESAELQTLLGLIATRDAVVSSTKGAAFRTVFESTLRLLQSPDLKGSTTCPLCGTTIGEPIEHVLTRHLEGFEEVAKAEKGLRDGWKSLTAPRRLRRLEESPLLAVDEEDRRAGALAIEANTFVFTGETLEIAWTSLNALEKKRTIILKTKAEEVATLEAKLPPSLVALSGQVQSAKEIAESIAEIREAVAVINQTSPKIMSRFEWTSFVTDVSQAFGELESALSLKRMQDIHSLCEQLFKEIMVVDDVTPRLERDSETESLQLKLANFHGLQDVGAAALLSESYRNAFAISVYLSAVLTTGPVAAFVVLDDISSSFDGGHQQFLLRALKEKVGFPGNPNGPQVIILSHDGFLEKHFDQLNALDGWVHTRIASTAPEGRVDAPALTPDRLKNLIDSHLQNGRTADAERLVRHYFEFALQQIIRKVNIPVPLDFAVKENSRLPGECIAAIKSAIDLQSRARSLVLTQQQLIDFQTLLTTGATANWLAHYNSSTTVPQTAAAIRALVRDVDKLMECFRYDCLCGSTIQRKFYRNLSTKGCSCP